MLQIMMKKRARKPGESCSPADRDAQKAIPAPMHPFQERRQMYYTEPSRKSASMASRSWESEVKPKADKSKLLV